MIVMPVHATHRKLELAEAHACNEVICMTSGKLWHTWDISMDLSRSTTYLPSGCTFTSTLFLPMTCEPRSCLNVLSHVADN